MEENEHRGTARILVGTCAWSDHQDFYPPGTKPNQQLGFYAQEFRVVEVDSTYYHMPSERNFALWTERTPDDFVFDVKAFKELTLHDRDVTPTDETFDRFASAMRPMREAGKLRGILFQFPPWFHNSPGNRDYIKSCAERMPDDIVTVEFRHRSWLAPENHEATLEFLRRNELAYVMVDEPQLGSGTVPTVVGVTNSRLAIVRFHGRNKRTWYVKAESTADRFDYLYQPEELDEWLPAVDRVASNVEELHLLFNNNRANYAVSNARDMIRILNPAAPV